MFELINIVSNKVLIKLLAESSIIQSIKTLAPWPALSLSVICLNELSQKGNGRWNVYSTGPTTQLASVIWTLCLFFCGKKSWHNILYFLVNAYLDSSVTALASNTSFNAWINRVFFIGLERWSVQPAFLLRATSSANA